MSELDRLGGIGPKRLRALGEAGVSTLRDFVHHLPRRYIDRTRITPIGGLKEGDEAFFAARVEEVSFLGTRLVVRVEDDTGGLDLVFFRGLHYLKPRFESGLRLAVAGTVTLFRELQIAHPEWEILEEGQEPRGGVLPVYPLTESMEEARLDHKVMQRAALEALERFRFTDPLPAAEKAFLQLGAEDAMLRVLHAPASLEEVNHARAELKIRELWPLCLKMEAARLARMGKGRRFQPRPDVEAALRAALPFPLTAGQEEVLGQLIEALRRPCEFHGLLQGDVGSGKTAVALLAAAGVAKQGAQAALLAPTEILAEQHFRTASAWLSQVGIETALLTASTPAEDRKRLVDRLRSGDLAFLIGTHALLSEDVGFKDLRFIVVDEQHRFGVEQRAAMAAKGVEPHLLFLSATPIPRTLAQSWYGDLELLTLGEKPPGRLPVKTRVVPAEKEGDLLAFLLKETGGGNQAYWVVPRIDAAAIPAGEKGAGFGGDAAVEDALRRLGNFNRTWRVEAVHGRLTAEERERVLSSFRKGETQVLVATTVIEVGVDVPGANLMVVEGGDRFGLAQLHQLRGRTGRGREQAWCFLMAPPGGWPDEAAARLREFTEEDDGFRIAELDLRRRGAGNLEGREQSGFGALRFADILEDAELVRRLRGRATEWLGGVEAS